MYTVPSSLYAMDPSTQHATLNHEHRTSDNHALELELPSEVPYELLAKYVMKQRLKEGYTLVRHRAVTVEPTAALYRGPLVTKPVPGRAFGLQSNIGTDLQVLDPDLSLLNISYSTAWSPGRTLVGNDASLAVARLKTSRKGTVEAHKSRDADLGRLVAGPNISLEKTDVDMTNVGAAHSLAHNTYFSTVHS
jgi:hypothetical protein